MSNERPENCSPLAVCDCDRELLGRTVKTDTKKDTQMDTQTEMENTINELRLRLHYARALCALKILDCKPTRFPVDSGPDIETTAATKLYDYIVTRMAEIEEKNAAEEEKHKVELMACRTRIFIEPKVEHARRLHETDNGEMPPGAGWHTLRCRKVLRAKRIAQQTKRGPVTDSALQTFLGDQYRQEVADMSIEELEHELKVQWDNQTKWYYNPNPA